MKVKFGLGVAVAATLTLAIVAPSASAKPVADHQAAPAVSQTYDCTTPIGDINLTGTVTGRASIMGKSISLTKVKFAVTNSVGLDLVVENVKVYVPDPSKANAPYKKGSVTIATKPRGWKAGHDSTGIFALFKGQQTIKAGDNVTVAALGAQYTAKGAKGTKIHFASGTVTFTVDSPVSGDVTCTPSPAVTFARVTE